MNLLTYLAGTVALCAALTPAAAARPIASIRVFNPTRWTGPSVIETPVGNLATPGLIDWHRVHLVAAGREVPFSLREGRPHWKAALTAPVRAPRAEDLLVFTCTAPPEQWLTLDVMPGRAAASSAVRRRAGRLVVTYPRVTVSVNAATGMLENIRIGGAALLRRPLTVQAWRASLPAVHPGEYGPGPNSPTYAVKEEAPLPAPIAALVSSASTPAMTELNFVLTSGPTLSLGLTYRIHASGLVEIYGDERPWTGRSPWLDRAVTYRLAPVGDAATLGALENRAPFYGFKDFNAVVRLPAAIYRRAGGALLSVGEETANGRRWNRRLYPAVGADAAHIGDLIEMANEGLVVDVRPVAHTWSTRAARIVCPSEDRAARDKIVSALAGSGLRLLPPSAPGNAETIKLKVASDAAALGISGDGFAVRAAPDGVSIVSGTRFGLFQAATRIAEQIDADRERSQARPSAPTGLGAEKAGRGTKPAALPLIASNPAVDFRSGGFGGGDFEVDFPYGDDAEWERVLSELAGSGMNVMTDLGMWSNWKMPVAYRYMPELRSNAPDAYDEVSGAKFSEIDKHRERGLKLLRFLHDRGVRVWLWLPIGAVPTTYAHAHPEAMSPHSDKIPCFTHPLYNKYLAAFLRELLETYPIDGVVMIRDDNGGICDCERCKAYLAQSRTRSPVWEQYLVLYDHLRSAGFKGGIGVYPYNDHYDLNLEHLLPTDLYIIGHGAGLGLLGRSYETCGPMGDTWIDNLFASFRLPGSARMKRLLSDRSSFWAGGAYHGTELTWEAIGRFGWEPTKSVNTFRYEWGRKAFGPRAAIPFTEMNAAYEQLWELNDLPMLPITYFRLGAAERDEVQRDGARWLTAFRERFTALHAAARPTADQGWFRQVGLFGAFFETHLRRLARLAEMQGIVKANRALIEGGAVLPTDARARLLALHAESYRDTEELRHEADGTPGDMMRHTREDGMLMPYKEWGLQPYGWYLEWDLKEKQFAGEISATVEEAAAGRPFTLRVKLHNRGFVPWITKAGQRLELGADAARLGLPERWYYDGDPMAPGDVRTIELHGTAPAKPGETALTLAFFPPFGSTVPTLQTTAHVVWK